MITLYSKAKCPFCDKAKEYLNENMIEFEEIDVESNPTAYTFIRERHGTVPQLYIGEKILVEGGWTGLKKVDPDMLKQLIKLQE